MSKVDIFQLGRALQVKFPDLVALDSPEIDLAIEDLYCARQEVERIVDTLNKLRPGDYDGLSQLLSDLHGLFDHTRGHLGESLPGLETLWRAVSDKSGATKTEQRAGPLRPREQKVAPYIVRDPHELNPSTKA